MQKQSTSKFLLPQEWTLFILFLVCTLFIPDGILQFIWDYNTAVVAFLIAVLTFQNYFFKKLRIPKDFYTIVFFSFTILNFASSIWAENIALVWEKSAMWMVLFVFYVNMRSLNFSQLNYKFWINTTYCVLFANILLIIYSFWLASQTPEAGFRFSSKAIDISDIFFRHLNGNYMTSVLVLWVPINIFLVSKKIGNQLLNILLLCLISFLILLFNSRASTTALLTIFIGSSFFHFKRNSNSIGFAYTGAAITIFTGFVFLFISDSLTFFEQYNPLRTVLEETGDDRLQIWNWSFELFKENPFLGAGTGNWTNEMLKYGVNDFTNFRAYTHAHNLFFETISELGVLGCLHILILLFFPILVLIKKKFENSIDFYLMITLIAFVIVNSFYGVTYLSPYFMCLWVLIISKITQVQNGEYFTSSLLLFPLLIISTCFLCFKKFADLKMSQYHAVLKADNALARQYIDQVYIPNVYEFYRNRSIHFLQENTLESNDIDASMQLLQQGLAKNPCDVWALYKLGKNHEKLNEFDKALTVYKKVIKLNERHFESYLAIAAIGNRKEYWHEFKLGASIFVDYAIPHKTKYFNQEAFEVEQKAKIKRFWNNRLRYLRQFQKLKRERRMLNKNQPTK